MPRRNQQEPKGPTISFEEGRRRLKAMRDKGAVMLEKRPIIESALNTWVNTTLEYIQKTFGEGSSHLHTFLGSLRWGVGFLEDEEAERLQERIRVLDSLLELIDDELSFSAPVSGDRIEDFWSRLHPSVAQVAKDRFNATHYADALEAAFKELNSKVKAYMKKATGQEYDGADLMLRALTPNAPVVRLADLSKQDGEDIQKGYMQIFAGSMTGIRNPKAHSNIIIDAPRAIHLLHLASLVHFVFDERL
jgi:uncharacterized protein (TIGR02391 family)